MLMPPANTITNVVTVLRVADLEGEQASVRLQSENEAWAFV